jgi:hypothetical protein
MKWSGLINADGRTVFNLADLGTRVGTPLLAPTPEGVPVRYTFCSPHTAMCWTVRTEDENLIGVTVSVSLLKNGVPFSTVVPPAATNASVIPIPPKAFGSGDDIEVQVNLVYAPGFSGTFIALVVVVEFQGPAGATGPTGPGVGSTGPTGPMGPTGTGPTSPGSLLKFSGVAAIAPVGQDYFLADTGNGVISGTLQPNYPVAFACTLRSFATNLRFAVPVGTSIVFVILVNNVAVLPSVLAYLAGDPGGPKSVSFPPVPLLPEDFVDVRVGTIGPDNPGVDVSATIGLG